MGDTYPKLIVAAVQAACPFIDREAATEKACVLIREAGANGADVIVFPEGFIPSHPNWFHHHIATGPKANGFLVELFKNSVEIPSSVTDALSLAARDADAIVVMGVCERIAGTVGTMFNSQVYISADGKLIGKHQKLMPTAAERLAHAGGHGDTLGVFPTPFGPMSSLICGENNNPLAVFALTAQHTRIHAMSWPPYVAPIAAPVRDLAATAARNFAEVAGAFVVSACGALDDETIAKLEPDAEQEAWLRDPRSTGGSIIVAPNGQILAGPMGNEEGILYAECDLEAAVRRKLNRDYAGHYNRGDVFQVRVNTKAPLLFETVVQDVQTPNDIKHTETADGRSYET